jgi:hypothetical protein
MRGFRGLALRAVTCDILSVGRLVLAVVRQQASASGSLISSHMFWYGIPRALGVVWILPGRIAGLLFVIALLATGLLHRTGCHAYSVGVTYLIVAVIAVLVGLYSIRIRGLRQLGKSDFGMRLRNAGESAAGCSPGHVSARWKER